MKPLIVQLGAAETLVREVALATEGDIASVKTRLFPDGETYFRVLDDCRDRQVVIVANLDRPNGKMLPLIFATRTLRELGAKRIGLLAPYLPYMRQDKRFFEGEAVTSVYFAELVSQYFDWLVTVDPHLHRHDDLSEIYTIPTRVVQAAPAVSTWVRAHVNAPLIVGPDEESAQWVRAVAAEAGAPHVVMTKVRHGDRDVEIHSPDLAQWRACMPVLLDDIISSGATMRKGVERVRAAGFAAPLCIGIHAIFAGGALDTLVEAGVETVVTTNTVPHATNGIDVAGRLAEAVDSLSYG